ncbi:hypothetical protein DQ384_22805 [Sphaerisporangium album]|uniref:Uncharacterized protein n=1 Tax=Sphaerisporangium album TaxID=509200 RepID=A0A367FFZ3_9ACTN|nr:hypothetical protein DQ384_22805 [Sphaerisporangium album]
MLATPTPAPRPAGPAVVAGPPREPVRPASAGRAAHAGLGRSTPGSRRRVRGNVPAARRFSVPGDASFDWRSQTFVS